jgi:putative phosphoribosyl transferase
MRFRDRRDAGRQLAERLVRHRGEDLVVLGLVRGGVVVAYEVARALGAPLDVLVVRKIGVPWHPELALGAVAPGVTVLRQDIVSALGLPRHEVERLTALEEASLGLDHRRYRGDFPAERIRGRSVIVVDDGLATGASAVAAIRSVRHEKPARVTLAEPVCAAESARLLREEADEVVCLVESADFAAVGAWYDDFGQVDDEEVRELLRLARTGATTDDTTRPVRIGVAGGELDGDLTVPPGARGLVLFAHGSGSGRRSPRNVRAARGLQKAGFGTLLFDLLLADEARLDEMTAEYRFNIGLLAERLADATHWARRDRDTRGLPIAYFGASTGAAAALVAAAEDHDIAAVVSRGGRPDLAGDALPRVVAPTLLIVGGADPIVLDLNRQALARLGSREKELAIVEGATHLFEEPGAIEEVVRLASEWLLQHVGVRTRG